MVGKNNPDTVGAAAPTLALGRPCRRAPRWKGDAVCEDRAPSRYGDPSLDAATALLAAAVTVDGHGASERAALVPAAVAPGAPLNEHPRASGTPAPHTGRRRPRTPGMLIGRGQFGEVRYENLQESAQLIVRATIPAGPDQRLDQGLHVEGHAIVRGTQDLLMARWLHLLVPEERLLVQALPRTDAAVADLDIPSQLQPR